MTTTINVEDARANLPDLLKAVERGESFLIARSGQPIARLGPPRNADIAFGGMTDAVSVADDAFTSATDAEIWARSEYAYEATQ